jgi:site-specific DNA-cytosine methylase
MSPVKVARSIFRNAQASEIVSTSETCGAAAACVGCAAGVLTIAEQRVIAGFPSDYPLPRVRRAAVKALGASVIPACSEWLFNKVMEVIR